MKPRTIAYTYHITVDRTGYVIVDADGEPVEAERYRTWAAAAARLTQMEGEEADAERQSRADYIDDHE